MIKPTATIEIQSVDLTPNPVNASAAYIISTSIGESLSFVDNYKAFALDENQTIYAGFDSGYWYDSSKTWNTDVKEIYATWNDVKLGNASWNVLNEIIRYL